MPPSWVQKRWNCWPKEETNRVVAYKHGEFVDFDIQEALNMTKDIPEDQYEISKLLVR